MNKVLFLTMFAGGCASFYSYKETGAGVPVASVVEQVSTVPPRPGFMESPDYLSRQVIKRVEVRNSTSILLDISYSCNTEFDWTLSVPPHSYKVGMYLTDVANMYATPCHVTSVRSPE